MFKKILVINLLVITQILVAQNLILNSSFSNVKPKVNNLKSYKISSKLTSEVENWYIPDYIYKLNIKSPYQFAHFYSSRDKELVPKNRMTQFITNGEQLFENNLGFMYMNVMRRYSLTVIQQKLKNTLKKGKYCFKFKYKFNRYSSSYQTPVSIDFAFSSTDLKEYYNKTLLVPENLIQINFKDTINDIDDNAPWIQKCYEIDLKEGEQFLSIGTLNNKDKYPWGTFFIDDIELYLLPDTGKCNCEVVKKDLSKLYLKNFQLDTILQNDTMVMFAPSFNVGAGIMSPGAKVFLNTIVAFMQRNPKIKIRFIEYNHFKEVSDTPGHCMHFIHYLYFFGIGKERVSARNTPCLDDTGFYCGSKSEFVKIGFMFYRE